jgi:5'-nucleotidase
MSARLPHRVLVTNDDGVSSPGLWYLAAAVSRLGCQVVVAAPRVDSSGFAAAVGDVVSGAVIETAPAASPLAPGIEGWSVEGPPARCVLAGVLGVFGSPPDVVMSGINAGANTGRFLQLHSGTLGAALAAGNSGLRAMAVSLDVMPGLMFDGSEQHWSTAAEVAARLLGQLIVRPVRTVWNVNVPNLPLTQLRGVAEARPGRSRQQLRASEVATGRHVLDLVALGDDAGTSSEGGGGPAVDRTLLDGGIVSVVGVTVPGIAAVGGPVLELSAGE